MISKYPVAAIAAMAKNRAIGVANDLPWSYPEDMNFFRDKTKKSVMIMGRKTFDSFKGKTLPGRFHIVITRTPEASQWEQVVYVKSLEDAFKIAGEKAPQYLNSEIFVIGGAEIYKMALPKCDRIYLTLIDKSYPGEAFFPEFSEKEWALSENRKSSSTPNLTFQIWNKR